jgi:hypothetical protein
VLVPLAYGVEPKVPVASEHLSGSQLRNAFTEQPQVLDVAE